jgi:hypothetical protein
MAGELLANLLGDEGDKIMHLVILPLDQLHATIDGAIGGREDTIGLPQHIESLDVEIGLDQVESPHHLDHPQRQQVEHVLESAWRNRYLK